MFLRAILITTALVLTGPTIAQDNATPPGEAMQPAAAMDASEFATKAAVSNVRDCVERTRHREDQQ
jgi:hypothetical protein